MNNAKAVYAAIAAILTGLLLRVIPPDLAFTDLEGHIRLLIEVGVHAIVQSTAVYWTAWWVTNTPEIPQ